MNTVLLVARRGGAHTEAEQAARDAFGARLDALRKNAGIETHAELAKKAGLDRTVVTRLINGDNRANMDQIQALSRALGLRSPVALLSDEGAHEVAGVSLQFSRETREVGVILDQVTDRRLRMAVAKRIVGLIPTLIADERAKKPAT